MIKTKNQSKLEFFEALQHEYFVAVLRCRIYPSPKKKEYFKKVADGKREKFEDLSRQLGLPTVLEDEELHNSTKDKIFGTLTTQPTFLYRDDQEKEELEMSDFVNYYAKDSEVTFILNDNWNEVKPGKIKEIDILNETAIISSKSSSVERSIKLRNLKRAL